MVKRLLMARLLGSAVVNSTATAALAITPEQAARGEMLFEANCSGCHGPGGGSAPPLAGAGTLTGFGSARALFEFVSVNMPRTAPGSLPAQTYLDIVGWAITSAASNAMGWS